MSERSSRVGPPRWVVGVLLVGGVQACAALYSLRITDQLLPQTTWIGCAIIVALLAAGLIGGGNGRQVAVMVIAAGGLVSLRALGIRGTADPAARIERAAAAVVAVVCLAAWLGEFVSATGPDAAPRRAALRGGLLLTIIAAAGAAAVVVFDHQALSLLDLYVRPGVGPAVPLADVMLPVLVAFCAWCAADAALAATWGTKASRAMLVGTAALLVLVLPAWWTAQVQLAGRTMEALQAGGGGGVISPFAAAAIVARHGEQRDIDRLWDLIAAPAASNAPRDPILLLTWRQYLIKVLLLRNRDEATERLSQAVMRVPEAGLVADAAGVLADERRYETVPLLLRYALLTWPQSPIVERYCAAALEELRIPEAAAVILRDSRAARGLAPMPEEAVRERLGAVLGHEVPPPEAGTDELAWLHRQFAAAKGPLTPSIRAEADATVDAIYAYWAARDRAATLTAWIPQRIDFDTPTTDAFVRQVRDYAARVAEVAAPGGR